MDLAGIRHFIIFILISVGLHCSGLLLNRTFESQQLLTQQIGVILLSGTREGFYPAPEIKAQAASARQNPLPAVSKKDLVAAAGSVKKPQISSPREDMITAAVKPALPTEVARPLMTPAQRSRPEPVAAPIQNSAKAVGVTSAAEVTKVVSLVPSPVDRAGKADAKQSAEALSPAGATLRQETRASGFGGNQALAQLAVPLYAGNPKPEYPKIARLRGWEGTVRLDVVVRKDGRVGKVELADSSGFRALDQVALKTVYRWRFKPAMSSGAPVESTVQVPVRFVLNAQP